MHQTTANQLMIRTPEGISFAMVLASPLVRFLAWVVDSLAASTISFALFKLLVLLSVFLSNYALALYTILQFGVGLGFSILFEIYWRGQTPGKRLFRLKVMDSQGLKLHPSQVIVRNLLRFVDFLPGLYALGASIALFNRKYQRLGDIAAGTVVIRQPVITQPRLDQIDSGKFNSLRERPHLEARLRQVVTPLEAAMALQAVLRRDEFEPAARVELFSQLSAHFKQLVEFPPELVETISDEQYVRNVVDVLYRARASKPPEALKDQAA